MKIRNEKSIATIYDAVSILKGLDIINGSLKQNYYAESALFVPDRFINPLILRPKIDISDPSGSIPNGDKVYELARLEWFENGVKINSNDDFKIEGANLTIFKNSEGPFEISYRAEWFDSRKKQVITIEDSVVVSCISLAQSDANTTISLSKPQNWVHNPLKGERIYKINAYVSKDKVHESAVEWYYVDSNKNDVLIDDSCSFYVEGQYTNTLKVDSAYMDNVIIKAKNISNDKLKEIYWFFDKHGNPVTHKTPEKTEVKGANVFSLPESPITSKLDYRIGGLTLTNLVKNGDFSNGTEGWQKRASVSHSINADGNLTITLTETTIGVEDYDLPTIPVEGDKYYIYAEIGDASDGVVFFDIIMRGTTSGTQGTVVDTVNTTPKKWYKISNVISINGMASGYNRLAIRLDGNKGDSIKVNNITAIPLTDTFGAGNEPSKEWCDEHIQGYFEGTKSVTAPLRIKSEVGGRNYFRESLVNDLTYYATDGGIIQSDNSNKKLGFYMPVKPKEVYTIHREDFRNDRFRVSFTKEEPQRGKVVDVVQEKDYSDRLEVRGIMVPDGCMFMHLQLSLSSNPDGNLPKIKIEKGTKPTDWTPAPEDNAPATGGTLYINNNLELKSVGEVKDYIENGKLYKYISDDGEILEQPEIVNLSTQGSLTTYPNGTIFIEPATLVEKQYNDGLKVDLPIKTLESIKVGTEYLDVSKAVVKENLITHPELENGDFVTIEYIYDDNPIYGTNSIGYLSLEEILDDLWLDNVYTYKITNGEWELVKVTDIEDYEEWLKTEKTSPYTLAPDGVIFGSYEAETKFIRQYPSSLYVDIIAPTRLKENITQIKARALVGTADGVVENPSKYFDISWYKKSNKAGASDVIIGEGEELVIDVADVDRIGIEVESKAIKK